MALDRRIAHLLSTKETNRLRQERLMLTLDLQNIREEKVEQEQEMYSILQKSIKKLLKREILCSTRQIQISSELTYQVLHKREEKRILEEQDKI